MSYFDTVFCFRLGGVRNDSKRPMVRRRVTALVDTTGATVGEMIHETASAGSSAPI